MKVLLLQGGPSAEREISLLTAANVRQGLTAGGHEVSCLDPDPATFADTPLPECDVVFIALHGTFGEDGQLQRLLEERGLPYTGSDPLASRVAFRKDLAKRCFQRQLIRTPAAVQFTPQTPFPELQAAAAYWGFPVFVKPNAQGSSLGVSCVTASAQLDSACQTALTFDQTALIEPAIRGTEWTLGLFDEFTFPLVRVQPQQPFYDYHAKYTDRATEFLIAPELAESVSRELTQAARAAYTAVGASGLARVDLILDTQQRAWVLEVNTLPGLTPQSSIPRAAAHLGWSMTELCERICQAAINRHAVSRTLSSEKAVHP